MTDHEPADAPATVNVTPLEKGGISVTMHVPTYGGGASFTMSATRDPDGDWRVNIPWMDDTHDEPILVQEMECLNGFLYLGSPDHYSEPEALWEHLRTKHHHITEGLTDGDYEHWVERHRDKLHRPSSYVPVPHSHSQSTTVPDVRTRLVSALADYDATITTPGQAMDIADADLIHTIRLIVADSNNEQEVT